MAKTILFLCMALLMTTAAKGDSFWNVTGTATIYGNSVCGGSCDETINFSIVFDEFYSPPDTGFGAYALSVVSDSATFSGPLSLLFSNQISGPFPGPGNDNFNYLAFYSPPSAADEFDLWLTNNVQPTAFIPGVYGLGEFSCSTAVCQQDFCTPDATHTILIDEGCYMGGQGNYIKTKVTSSIAEISGPVPEPSTIALTALGLFFLLFGPVRRMSVISHFEIAGALLPGRHC